MSTPTTVVNHQRRPPRREEIKTWLIAFAVVLLVEVSLTKGDDNILCNITHAGYSRLIYPLPNGKGKVLCDTASDGGGWTVFQRRATGKVDFNQNWTEYAEGFGSIEGDFWLGLENIYQLCQETADCGLRIDFTFQGTKHYLQWEGFSLNGSYDNYRMSLPKPVVTNTTQDILYAGVNESSASNASNASNPYTVNRMQFTTCDRDNDLYDFNCAVGNHAGWWWNACGQTNLNGNWANRMSVFWMSVTGSRSVSFSEMKVRVRPGVTLSNLDTSALDQPETDTVKVNSSEPGNPGVIFIPKWATNTTVAPPATPGDNIVDYIVDPTGEHQPRARNDHSVSRGDGQGRRPRLMYARRVASVESSALSMLTIFALTVEILALFTAVASVIYCVKKKDAATARKVSMANKVSELPSSRQTPNLAFFQPESQLDYSNTTILSTGNASTAELQTLVTRLSTTPSLKTSSPTASSSTSRPYLI